MATRTIASPGVQINETDLSIIARSQVGTNIFITGFTSQGPTDEIVNISSVSEYETVFGIPTNEAERYLYHTARQILTQSPGNLMVTRMAYGSGHGSGFANTYSALVYGISAVYHTQTLAGSYQDLPGGGVQFIPSLTGAGGSKGTWLDVFSNTMPFLSTYAAMSGDPTQHNPELPNFYAPTGALTSSYVQIPVTYENANYYQILAPKSVLLDEGAYSALLSNQLDWSDKYTTTLKAGDELGLGNAGIIIANPSKVSINEIYEGYYVGLADNSNNNPATNFDAVGGMKAVAGMQTGIGDIGEHFQTFVDVSSTKLNFKLSATPMDGSGSISEVIEQYPTGFDFGSKEYNDSLSLVYLKVRSSIYAQDTVKLDYSIQEAYSGSLYSKRTQNNPRGGAPVSFALEKLVNQRSSDVKVIVNPYISEIGNWNTEERIALNSPYVTSTLSPLSGTARNYIPAGKTVRIHQDAKNLYSQGVFVENSINGDDLGDVPLKLQRVLQRIDDLEVDVDIIPEAGLGTIWTQANCKLAKIKLANSGYTGIHFDPTFAVSAADLADLKNQDVEATSALRTWYQSIAQQFSTFAEKTRKDHMFIADPLRCIFANGPWDIHGKDKTVKRFDYVFSSDIYWALKNLYANTVTSYAAAYGNWLLFNDVFSNKPCWLPASGYVAADIALSSATSFPWSAPAGFSRGQLSNVLDIAINPTQKQRDLLYRVNINPIAYFAGDGYVIFGQKTLFNKPSAFDRINVRRLFLTLEKITLRLLKYYTFEPNTFATRARLVSALSPVFSQAKNNDGLYAYKIVCDERNNTPDVIDNNELRVAIYIQPVRTAEFILADFIATRTGADFNELTS